jgi:hypothetical protein
MVLQKMSFSQEQRVFIVEHYFASHSYARVADEFRHLSGYVNSQNNKIWSSENPHVLHEKPL